MRGAGMAVVTVVLEGDSGWPSYINKGTYNISARLYARFGWGAGSPGPIQVAICEMPDRCLLPLELREFTSGGLVVAEASRVWDGTTLFPRAVKVSSLSTDLFLAEFVDVELLGQWRRFPLNRWLLMQEHLTDATVWETFTAPPLPTAAPAQSHYTEGDRCGGCGLGTICRERPQTALELAQKGISLATATEVFMTWDCQFACGDGLVVGEEQCDDGNLDALDGCDANCKVEPGFVCDGSHGFAPSQCRAIGCGAAPHPSQHISAACASDLRCDLAPVRPKAVLAQFVDQGNFLLVAFDAALAAWNGTDLGEEIPCSEFFTPTTVAELGDRAACIQGSPQHLLVRLGFGASLGEAATAVFVLDTARQYQQINSPVEVSRVFEFPAQRLFLGPALGETSNFVKPTVILRGPTVWGQCGDLHLDGSFSLGSTGRPWKLIRWRCTGDGSSCAKIVGYLPNSCDQQTPLETTGLAVGPVPCGLRATIPEAVASDLTISLATLEIHLKLENAMGLWDEAVHRIRFTVDRVPMAVALSDPAMTVDEGSSVRLELSVGPALPVASLGAGSSCGALGPVSLEWRYSYGSLLDPSQASVPSGQHGCFEASKMLAKYNYAWPSLTNTPPSLIASLDAKTAALEGTLGDLDVPGSNWTLVARDSEEKKRRCPRKFVSWASRKNRRVTRVSQKMGSTERPLRAEATLGGK
ncbi:unnamed protein product [Durusdinium trenchii]|uniref:Uncharacterized protein n=1 Tax=Durusdinium trenchii TaxID=1381693 RepID=A0ABP0IL20_9DINO